MEFKTLKGVPIVSTGTYDLGTGKTTFTADDLASAVLAANDPTVSAPRIKIGHIDERFENDESLDGEPAMGTVENLTLTDDGQTIVGDLTNVPAWLADSMHSAYPGRSIEGGFGYTAPSGHNYKLAISNLSLLGTTWPGVGSLPDLQEVLSRNGSPNDVTASSERTVMASVGNRTADERRTMASKGEAMGDGSFPIGAVTELEAAIRLARTDAQRAFVRKRAKALGAEGKIPDSWGSTSASLDLGAVPRTFAADLVAGKVPKSGDLDQAKWWPRSVEAADDGALSILVDTAAGKLLRLPITVADKALNYGEPTAVTASGTLDDLQGPRVLASWPSNSEMASRPEEVKRMKIKAEVDQTKLAKRLGLPEDADEAAIEAALEADDEGTAATTTDADGKPVETPEAVAASVKVPEGFTLVDSKTLDEVRAGAAAGQTVASERAAEKRDRTILAAIKGEVPGDGGFARITASQRGSWENRWNADPEGTEKLLTAKADEGGIAALIPAGAVEAGHAGDGDGTNHEATAGRLFPELQEATA